MWESSEILYLTKKTKTSSNFTIKFSILMPNLSIRSEQYIQNTILNISYTGLFKMIVGVQLSSGNSAPNSGNNHHLAIPFEGGTHSFKRQGACVSRN